MGGVCAKTKDTAEKNNKKKEVPAQKPQEKKYNGRKPQEDSWQGDHKRKIPPQAGRDAVEVLKYGSDKEIKIKPQAVPPEAEPQRRKSSGGMDGEVPPRRRDSVSHDPKIDKVRDSLRAIK